MKKSIMFDVLNVIDGACKNSFEACEMKEYSLLKKIHTINITTYLN